MTEIVDYDIDHRLKNGRDYPQELSRLAYVFRERRHPGDLSVLSLKLDDPDLSRRRWIRGRHEDYLKQVASAEKTLKEFFFLQEPVQIRVPKVMKGRSPREIEKHRDWLIRENCVRRINAHLKHLNPRLDADGSGKYVIVYYAKAEHALFDALDVWEWLAKVVCGLDPKLVHQCPYCNKIFFSRQRKKYHPECRSKFISEENKKRGRSAKWQREYRERKKKRLAKAR